MPAVADRGDTRPLLLFYASRNLDDLTFREELEQLKAKLQLRVVYILENPPDTWQVERGFIAGDLLTRHLPDAPEHFEYYLCGPTAMTALVEKIPQRKGIPLHRIHSELFNLV